MARLREEADGCSSWSNGPGDRYAPHTHEFEKILYCVSGSITFEVGLQGRSLELGPGDRMVLPPGTVHAAVVGSRGVSCIEGRGRKMAAG